jgi:hypothetical protein
VTCLRQRAIAGEPTSTPVSTPPRSASRVLSADAAGTSRIRKPRGLSRSMRVQKAGLSSNGVPVLNHQVVIGREIVVARVGVLVQ